jgi:glycosyltransferase involved in cell wall biosynthesis
MRIAIVHDYLREMGGAERVLAVMKEMFPEADVIVSYIDNAKEFSGLEAKDVHTSVVQRLGFLWKRPSFVDRFLPSRLARSVSGWVFLLPLFFRTMDMSAYDVIVSSTAYCSHHVRKRRGQLHVCYCHTPPRFLWQFPVRPELHGLRRAVWGRYIRWFRRLDLRAASKVDHFIANSETVRERIRDYYGRESNVVYPPVDLLERTGYIPGTETNGEYYLVVSRLDPLKRVGPIVEAFNKLGLPLVVVGTGTEDGLLHAMAGPNVTFTGFVSDDGLCRYYDGARAVVIAAQDEDFGITAVEAQVFGKPVIAANEGGFRETVIDGETGVLFDMTSAESIIRAVERFEDLAFDRETIKRNGARFSKQAFISAFASELRKLGVEVPSNS